MASHHTCGAFLNQFHKDTCTGKCRLHNYIITHRITGKWKQGEDKLYRRKNRSPPPSIHFHHRTFGVSEHRIRPVLESANHHTTLCLWFPCGGSSEAIWTFQTPYPPIIFLDSHCWLSPRDCTKCYLWVTCPKCAVTSPHQSIINDAITCKSIYTCTDV